MGACKFFKKKEKKMKNYSRGFMFFLAFFLLVSFCFAAGSKEKRAEEAEFTIGYVCNYMSHQWYQNIILGMKEKAAAIGAEVKVADSDLDQNRNISEAESFIAQKVDVLVITPVDPNAIGTVIQKAEAANIPVVTEGFVVEGADTYVGIEDYWSGYYGGETAGEYVKENFGGRKANILLIDLPFEIACRARCDGFMDGFTKTGVSYELIARVDGGGMIDQALDVATDAFTAHREINVVFGINDDSSLGAYEAAKAVGMNIDPKQFLIVTCGFEGAPGMKALEDPSHPLKVAICMFPQMVGYGLVEAAYDLYQGKTVPEIQYTPTIAVTPETQVYYSWKGEDVVLDFSKAGEIEPPTRSSWWDEGK
jgi:ABC-type sugar transport system substrate-binding protein